MNSKITQTGTLIFGVVVGVTVHREFELRPPTVQDNIVAIDEVGTSNPVALSAAMFARQLVKLGGLEPKAITTDVLRTMHPRDFDAIERASIELEKKLLGDAANSGGGSPAASPFRATESPSPSP